MGLSFLSPSRAVVLLMDDGVVVHKCAGGSASFVGGVLWRNGEFEERLAELVTRTGCSSVLILNDAVEQHYRKEKVTVPTMFDRANIIKRRLNVAFPNYPMRAAVELKEATAAARAQAGKEDKGSSVYLFAAAPSTDSFSRVISALSRTDCSIFGYGLLPVESASLVSLFTRKFSSKWGGASAGWSVLLGQHRGGGLRQIVVRGNELALTRVTSVDDPKEGAGDVWAADVNQELQATLSYLARFGYSPDDGLNVIVIGDKSNAELIEGLVSVPCNFMAVSPQEAAHHLGFKLNRDETDHYADPIHAGWAAKKMALVLPLTSKEIASVAGPRRQASLMMLVLSLAFGAAFYMASQEALLYYKDSKNLEVAQLRKVEIERLYQEEIKRKESMGIDINLIKGALDIERRIKRQHIDVLAVLKEASRDLKNLRMDGFEFKNEGDVLWHGNSPDEAPPVRAATFNLKFSFPGNINPKDGNKDMFDLADRINTRLSPYGYSAKVSVPLQNLTYTGEVDKEVGLAASQRSLTDRYSSEILIQKVKNAQSSGN